jgi:trk system potassium uptake protein TrkA
VKALVIGAGEVGMNVAKTLAADGQNVTMVDKDPGRCEHARVELDALVVEGNGASPVLLRELGVSGFSLVAAVTAVDEVNLIAALTAHQLGSGTTIARVRDPELLGRDDPFATGILGIDFVIDPDRAAAADIAAALQLPGAVSVEYFGDGELALAELIVTDSSPLVGKPLSERERPHPAFIVGLTRDGVAQLTRPEMVPQPGDHLLVTSPKESIRAAVAHLAGTVSEVHRCTIFGGGKIGLALARRMEDVGVHVTILERDRDRARKLAEKLPRTRVLIEDGMAEESLIEAGAHKADAFVACAGDDRMNLLAALNGKRIGADLCVATVSREEFTPLVDAIGLDAAFSPRLITAEQILRFVHTRSVKAIHLTRTGFEALELEVRPRAQLVGKAIGETGGLLHHCRVGAILHEEGVSIPQRGTPISAGDRLLLLGPVGTVSEVEEAFAGAG